MMKVVRGQGTSPVTKASTRPSAAACPCSCGRRAPYPYCDDENGTCDLERRCATSASDRAADHEITGEHQDDGRTDMGQDQDDAGADAAEKPGRPSEIVGYDHGLAVAGHEGVDHPEDGSKGHRSEELERAEIAGKPSQFGGRAAIQPALDVAEKLHR